MLQMVSFRKTSNFLQSNFHNCFHYKKNFLEKYVKIATTDYTPVVSEVAELCKKNAELLTNVF